MNAVERNAGHGLLVSARGFVLLPVLCFVLALALVAWGASRGGPAAVAQLAQGEDAAAARYAAEAGIAHATWAAAQSDCGSYADLAKEPFGAASYDVSYGANSGSPVRVRATGSIAGGASHSLERTIDVYQLPLTVEEQPDEANADTLIEDDGAIGNHDKKELKILNKSGEEARALLQVDVSAVPAGARIVGATLALDAKSSDTLAGATLAAHALTRGWSEQHATWTAYDVLLVLPEPWTTAGGDFETAAAALLALDNSTGWKTFDLTTLVQRWIGGEMPNHGVLLKANNKVQAFEFYTSDETDAARRPKVTVRYVCPCGSTCAPELENGTTLVLSTLNDASLAGLSFEDGDLVSYDPGTVTAAPVVLENDVFAGSDADIDAFVIRDDGRIVLSTEAAASIAGLAFEDEDLVEYDPKAVTATLLFDGSAHFAANEDVDGAFVYDDGRIVLLTGTAATLGGIAFDDDDLADYDPGADTATLIFDGGARFSADENIDAVQMLEDGRFLLSTDSDATLGGIGFTDADVVLYDPLEDRAAKVYDGSTLTSTPDADVDGVQDYRPHVLVDELRLEPVADTYIASAAPGTSFGGAPNLNIGNNLRAMIKFDLAALPLGATVTSATLYLNLGTAGGLSLVTGAYKVTAPWAEGTATWSNTGNGGSFDILPVATATFTAATARWVAWSLPPPLLQEWRDGVTANHGLLLKPTAIALGSIATRSRNHGSSAVHPRLVLKYTLP